MRVGSKVLGVIALLAAAAVVPAKASVIYDLTSDHCTGGCGTAPFGNITLDQNGTTVDITVHLNTGFAFAKTGAADDQAFKFNAVGVVLGDITVDAHVPILVADAGAFNGDGTGNFGFGIICSSCGGGLSDAFSNSIVFHVANATIADLTAPNNLGNVFVADVGNLATGNTGPVDATVPRNPVPEPITSGLVGTGLVSLFFLRRRAAK